MACNRSCDNVVCGGSQWKMRLRYSDRTVKRVVGTAAKSVQGRKIEKMIEDMLTNVKCVEMPVLFGCYGQHE